MATKVEIKKLLEKYILWLGEDLEMRWNSWVNDLENTEIYEVIGGLMSRQVSIANEFASNSNLWNPNIAPILMRSLIDNYINFSWITRDPLERSQKYIYFGLGQDKLQLEHRKSLQNTNPSEENRMIIDAIESWINSQNYDFLTSVNVGSWSEKSVRDMAAEINELELFNYCYQPFSCVAHNMWNHVAKYNLKVSENPLHRFTKIPVIFNHSPDFYWFELAIKYTHKMFVKFDESFSKESKLTYAAEKFSFELDKLLENANSL